MRSKWCGVILGAEDRVVFSHLLGEDHTVEAGGNDFSLLLFLFTGADGSQKRADTDTGSAQIADLIDLQAGIDLSGVGQNIFYLVGGNGVRPQPKEFSWMRSRFSEVFT